VRGTAGGERVFSSRLRHGVGRNRLALAVEQRRGRQQPIIDLTESNPTRASLQYPVSLLAPLKDDRALRYDPQPFGLRSAREAVAADFARRGVRVPVERIVLTSGTSEAYSILLKLLCDPADSVLAARPSYPLVEHLAELDAVAIRQYRLDFHGRWDVDLADVERRLREAATSGPVRAIILVSPNNPTGSIISAADLGSLAALASRHDLALIVDEVFADYPMNGQVPTSALSCERALTFSLGGLSKSIGLPQLKLAWIGVSGPEHLVPEAMERLETMCDAYLSVSTPVQAAAPELMKSGAAVRGQILSRVRSNLARLQQAALRHPSCAVLPVEAGWYAVVQVPALQSEEAIVLDLLERTGILVHPGYFFDFEREAFVVVSLLPDEAIFAPAAETLLRELS
jgi:alanine-synthesizing transaminase